MGVVGSGVLFSGFAGLHKTCRSPSWAHFWDSTSVVIATDTFSSRVSAEESITDVEHWPIEKYRERWKGWKDSKEIGKIRRLFSGFSSKTFRCSQKDHLESIVTTARPAPRSSVEDVHNDGQQCVQGIPFLNVVEVIGCAYSSSICSEHVVHVYICGYTVNGKVFVYGFVYYFLSLSRRIDLCKVI